MKKILQKVAITALVFLTLISCENTGGNGAVDLINQDKEYDLNSQYELSATYNSSASLLGKLLQPQYNETEQKHASDIYTSDQFGRSVSIDGVYAIAGAPYEDGGILNPINSAGTAYVYKRQAVAGLWIEKQILLASNIEATDNFGTTVSIRGNYAMVSALYEDADSSDPSYNTGAVYVFERDSSDTWNEIQILHASDMHSQMEFGKSISIEGNYAVIGAPRAKACPPSIACGSVYIFELINGNVWTEIQIINASDEYYGDSFGGAVSINGERIVVGAMREDGGTGSPDNDAGAVYIFERNTAGVWVETANLHASNKAQDDYFGASVSIYGDHAIVGAYQQDGPAGNTNKAGAIYFFYRQSGGNWVEIANLYASNMQAGDVFGSSVSIYGEFAIVGAPGEDGKPSNPDNTNYGAAYVFRLINGTTWTQIQRFRSSDKEELDHFGSKVAMSGRYAIFGVPWEDGGPNRSIPYAGAIYFFKRPFATP